LYTYQQLSKCDNILTEAVLICEFHFDMQIYFRVFRNRQQLFAFPFDAERACQSYTCT